MEILIFGGPEIKCKLTNVLAGIVSLWVPVNPFIIPHLSTPAILENTK